MKIKGINRYTKHEMVYELEAVVKAKVEDRDCDGQLESLQATVRNLTTLVAQLLEAVPATNEQLTEWLADYGETLEKV